MTPDVFWLTAPQEPQLIAEAASYLVLYKPPRMHTAPLKEGEENTLLAWAASLFPDVLQVHGYKTIEGGLLHRLDYETQGLTLFARTDMALAAIAAQQEKNLFIKEYDAVSAPLHSVRAESELPGFPPYPSTPYPSHHSTAGTAGSGTLPLAGSVIESAFRPYGKGRKAVRPLIKYPAAEQRGISFSRGIGLGFNTLMTAPEGQGIKPSPRIKGKTCYSTEICSCTEEGGKQYFRLRITKGFRHQIRCHLAWINRPLLNDTLYGGNCDGGFLALRACALAFADPENGEAREYRLSIL
ncbi:MAG: RNA pseudouridine synthase [Spirochaetaceae bacterium]|jgi:23S rRNA pseudouridine1911/1915/1917 synthase|nr:RNA pseudouridine synthase [Spirochaetaceae bacterium]